MKWFEGPIKDAVRLAKKNNCFFAVYVEGNDELSKTMTSVINSQEISAILESDKFICVKIKFESEEYHYFVQIYKHVPIPSLFLIGLDGVPVAVVNNLLTEDEQNIRREVLKTLKRQKSLISEGECFKTKTISCETVSNLKMEAISTSAVDEENNIEIDEGACSVFKTKQPTDTVADKNILDESCLLKPKSDEEIKQLCLAPSLMSKTNETINIAIIQENPGESFLQNLETEEVQSMKRYNLVLVDSVSGSTVEVKGFPNARIDKVNEVESVSEHNLETKGLTTVTTYAENEGQSVSGSSSGMERVSTVMMNEEHEGKSLSLIQYCKKDNINEDLSVAGNVTEFDSSQRGVPVLPGIELELPVLPEQLRHEDCQQTITKDDTEQYPNHLRRRLTSNAAEINQKPKYNENTRQEKFQNDIDRQRILKEIALDREERLARQKELRQLQLNALNEPLSELRSTEPTTGYSRDVTQIQFRKPDGSTLTVVFNVNCVINDLRVYITRNIPTGYRQFDLAIAFPSHIFSAEENGKTLEELALVPNAVILILPISANSGVISYVSTTVTNTFWFFISPLLSILQYLRDDVFRPILGSINFSLRVPLLISLLPRLNRNSNRVRIQQFSNDIQNVHTMTNISDNDDENNTWNGNSTQQTQ